MFYVPTAIGLFFALVVPTVTAQRSSDELAPSATIDSGPLTGRVTRLPDSSTAVNQFLGIPFAQPPVDDLRFAPPQPPIPWEEPYNATSQPLACMQYFGPEGYSRDLSEMIIFNSSSIPGESEDCLYLNVFAPSGGDSDKSVLFWLYGGSGTAGAISQSFYDGSSFAANHDIIVVTVSYRITVFGNPRSPQLPFEESNPGLEDQRLGLDWVQRNIHAFGGDPRKVTIMGESAGAVSVGHLINTYPDDPPFRAGVLQSGSSVVKIPEPPPNNDSTNWDSLMELLNCTGSSDDEVLACARTVPAETIRETLNTNSLVFGESIMDNITVLQYPGIAYLNGNVARVPILIGSTADDGSIFTLGAGDDVEAFIEGSFGSGTPTSQAISQLYAPGSPATANLTTGQEIIAQIVTDALFRCTSGFVANVTSTLLNVPVWQYVFDALVPSNQWDEAPGVGVYHASEIALIWGTYPTENSTELEAELSRSMQKQFADFVKNPEQGPGWGQWPEVAVLGVNETNAVTTTADVRDMDPVCATWDMLYLAQLTAPLGSTTDGTNGTETSEGTDSSSSSDSESAVTPDDSAAGRSAVSWLGLTGAGLLGLAALL